MADVIEEIAKGLAKVLDIMQRTIFTFAGIDLSLFDILFALLLIDIILMAVMPFYGGEDDD